MELAWNWHVAGEELAGNRHLTGVALAWNWHGTGMVLACCVCEAIVGLAYYGFRTGVLQERKRHGTGGAGMELTWNWRGTVVEL